MHKTCLLWFEFRCWLKWIVTQLTPANNKSVNGIKVILRVGTIYNYTSIFYKVVMHPTVVNCLVSRGVWGIYCSLQYVGEHLFQMPNNRIVSIEWSMNQVWRMWFSFWNQKDCSKEIALCFEDYLDKKNVVVCTCMYVLLGSFSQSRVREQFSFNLHIHFSASKYTSRGLIIKQPTAAFVRNLIRKK